jgi:glutamate synthase domain-containing protein 2
MRWSRVLSLLPVAATAGVALHDLTQRRHALLRNFPVIGHGRYLVEAVGPELRQYVVAANDEERPFTRDQRRWVYASSKLENNYFGFGTDNDVEHTEGYTIVKHRTFSDVVPPSTTHAGEGRPVPSAKVLGGPRDRRHRFRPGSVVNISAMSFGSLSGAAIESLDAQFSDVDSMLDWVELLADETGLPVGIKSAVGDLGFWEQLVEQMAGRTRGVDFVTVDGGEGGTGAAPLIFADSVALPFRIGFSRVYRLFAEAGLTDDVTFIGSGKLGLPDTAVVAFPLGCDLVNVAREAMLSVGCIQAQKCHTDRCPTGVATQDRWLAHGLDPSVKSVRAANYLRTLRRDLLRIAEACGELHPALVDADDIEFLFAQSNPTPLRELVGYRPGWGALSPATREAVVRLMAPAPQGRRPHS